MTATPRHPDSPWAFAALGVLVALVVSLARGTLLARTMNYRAVDRCFQWRHDVFHRDPAISPNIAVILLDDRTLLDKDLSGVPGCLWAPYWVKLVSGLLDARALAVGVDNILYTYDAAWYKPRFPGGDDPLVPLAQAVADHGQRAVMAADVAFQQGPDQVLAQAIDLPSTELMAVVGYDRLGLINMNTDPDGGVRRQCVTPLSVPRHARTADTDWDNGVMVPFGPLVAGVAAGGQPPQLKGEEVVFEGRPVPRDEGLAYINYAGPDNGPVREDHQDAACPFPTWSMLDVLHALDTPDGRQRMQAAFAGKVVLVGPGSLMFRDVMPTPFTAATNRQMLGIEVHASLVNTLLTGQYLTPVSTGEDVGLAVFFAVVAALCFRRLHMLTGLAVLPGLLVAVYGVTVWAFVWAMRVVHPFTALAAVAVVAALVYGWRFRFVWQMFGRYVSSTLLQETELLELGRASREQVTVLFTDINNFSTTCERHTPDEVIRMLNRYFEAMNEIIVKSGGWIKQFVGDEIMVIYGAPDPHPDPDRAAVETALSMVEKLAALKAEATGDGFFEIKAGIHTGDAIVGNVGSAQRTEYAAVGDDVNLGSRIMGMTKGLHATILISEATWLKVKDVPGLTFTDHGPQPVKGRHEQVRVYEVRRQAKEETGHAG